jgi:hypothetical protein
MACADPPRTGPPLAAQRTPMVACGPTPPATDKEEHLAFFSQVTRCTATLGNW